MITVDYLKKRFQLEPIGIEGGYFRRAYTSQDIVSRSALPPRYTANKHFCSAIYYVYEPDSCSRIHRLLTDEIYHFYLGDPITVLMLFPDGSHKVQVMGHDVEGGQEVQLVVPKEAWAGSCLQPGGKYAFAGASMSPGFDGTDFELGVRETLVAQYPGAAELITRLTVADPGPLLEAYPERAREIKLQGAVKSGKK